MTLIWRKGKNTSQIISISRLLFFTIITDDFGALKYISFNSSVCEILYRFCIKVQICHLHQLFVGSKHKKGMVPHRNKVFCDREIISLEDTDIGNKSYSLFHQFRKLTILFDYWFTIYRQVKSSKMTIHSKIM